MQESAEPTMEFPAGLRVLAVDDDRVCLRILDMMLRQCRYRVTTCERAADALGILRENKDGFDVVISDVHMPDMDGFKLLELVGLEMDLPVIMMSANDETSAVMKGIKHGACDYLLKPVRIEELKVIWQHVVRKRKEDDRQQRVIDAWDAHGGGGGAARLAAKKRKDAQQEEEEEAEVENEDPSSSSSSKKPRVVWSVGLHQKFVSAVDQLGLDKAVPKRILELMDEPGLTRENVASHLQKYRLYLKRLSAPPHQPSLSATNFGAFDERYVSASPSLADFRAHLPAKKPTVASPLLLDRANSDAHILAQMAAIHGTNSLAAAYSGAAPRSIVPGMTNVARFGLLDKNYGHLSNLSSSSNIAGVDAKVGSLVQRLPQQNSNPLQIAGGMLGRNGQLMLSGNNGTANARSYGTSDVGIYNISPFAANVVSPSIPLSAQVSPVQSNLYNPTEPNVQSTISRSIFSCSDDLAPSSRLSALSSSTDWLDADLRSHPSSLQVFSERDSKLSIPSMLAPKLETEASEPLSAAAMEDLLSNYMKQQHQQQDVLGLGLGDGDLAAEGFSNNTSDKMYVQ